jgi:hypothetical protein
MKNIASLIKVATAKRTFSYYETISLVSGARTPNPVKMPDLQSLTGGLGEGGLCILIVC